VVKIIRRSNKSTAKQQRLSGKKLLELIRENYDSFSFDGRLRVYNPSPLCFFFGTENLISIGWNPAPTDLSGNSSWTKISVEEFSGVRADKNFAGTPGEIETTPPKGFLYQAGYLTLR
jgi:hypothetical protein